MEITNEIMNQIVLSGTALSNMTGKWLTKVFTVCSIKIKNQG